MHFWFTAKCYFNAISFFVGNKFLLKFIPTENHLDLLLNNYQQTYMYELPISVARRNSCEDSAAGKNDVLASTAENWSNALHGHGAA